MGGVDYFYQQTGKRPHMYMLVHPSPTIFLADPIFFLNEKALRKVSTTSIYPSKVSSHQKDL